MWKIRISSDSSNDEARILYCTIRHLGANKGYASKHSIFILLLKTIPFLVQQNVGLVPGGMHLPHSSFCWGASPTPPFLLAHTAHYPYKLGTGLKNNNKIEICTSMYVHTTRCKIPARSPHLHLIINSKNTTKQPSLLRSIERENRERERE